MSKTRKTYPPSRAQMRWLNILGISPENLNFSDVAEILMSHGIRRNGCPFDTNVSTVNTWDDETLMLKAAEEKHMREAHNLIWCSVCKKYHKSEEMHGGV